MNFTENTIGGFSATSPMNHTEDVVNNFSSTSPMNHTEDVVNNFSSMNPTDKPADVFSTPSSITTDIDANTDLTIEHEINAIKNILQSDVKQSGGNDNPDISNSTSQNPVALSAIMGGGNKTPLDTNSNTGDDNDSDNKSDTDDDSDTDTDTDSTSDVKSNDNKEQSDSMVSRGGDSDILKILSASTTASSSSTTTTTSSSSTDNYSSPIDPRTHAINSRRNNMSKYMNDYVITSNSDTNYKVQTRPFYSSQSSDFLSSHGSEYLNNLRYRDRSQ
jgi:hypothetical protein